MSFLDKENKGLLWNFLQENDMFNGIPNDKFSDINKRFESILSNVNNEYNNTGVLEKNKIAISMSIDMIDKVKKEQNNSKLKVIYKSNDMKNEQSDKLNNAYNEQKTNLDMMINPKKPKDINFTDKPDLDIDTPIGDDMDRLIAERMKTREKELDIPSISEAAKQWVNNNNNNLENTHDVKEINEDKQEKKVSFDLLDKSSIFEKFKKKTEKPSIKNEVMEEINIKKELENLKSSITQLDKYINSIKYSVKLLEDNI
jgi:hypothetical protein